MKNKGISLIVLVITIVVIIILTGAIVLNLSANNPIDSATKAALGSDKDSVQSAFSINLGQTAAIDYSMPTVTAGTILAAGAGTARVTCLNASGVATAKTISWGTTANTAAATTYYIGVDQPRSSDGTVSWSIDVNGKITLTKTGTVAGTY